MHFTELSQHHRKGCQCISQNFQNFHNITGRGANAFHRTFRTFTTSQEGVPMHFTELSQHHRKGCQCISQNFQNFHNIAGRGANAFHRTFRTFTTSQEGVPMHFTELSELSQHHRKGCQCISQNFQNFHNITGRGANTFHRTFRTFTTSQEGMPMHFTELSELSQHLGISYRTGNRLQNPPHSTPRIHSLDKKHYLTNGNFKILDTANNESALLILESLYIFKNRPKLNMDSSAAPQSVVNK